MVNLHERWAKIVDKSRYLGEEFRVKEKEYGVIWRSSFNNELKEKMIEVVEKYGNPLEGSKYWNGCDKLDIIYFLIEKDYRNKVLLMAARF